jgi:hypothetical protein
MDANASLILTILGEPMRKQQGLMNEILSVETCSQQLTRAGSLVC